MSEVLNCVFVDNYNVFTINWQEKPCFNICKAQIFIHKFNFYLQIRLKKVLNVALFFYIILI